MKRFAARIAIVTSFSTMVIAGTTDKDIPPKDIQPFECITWETDAPVLMPWKTLRPDPAYHGEWLVAGDLDGDGTTEIVTARNDRQIVTTVLASRLDGSVLWRWGTPNTGKAELGYDVPVQIYDLNGDGRTEVYL